MSRIRPEELPRPKKVSKKRASELLATFSGSGTSKYDIYVNAAQNLQPGESLDVLVLPENVITSIQKKFRESGLTRASGYFVMSKTLGNEKGGYKSLLIGRHATAPSTKASRKSTKSSRSTSSKAATTASRAKVTAKRNAKTTPKTKRRSASGRKATSSARKNGVSTEIL